MNIFSKSKELTAQVNQLQSELEATTIEMEKYKAEVEALIEKNKELEAKATGVSLEEHNKVVENAKQLEADILKTMEENDQLKAKMEDFNKAASDAAVDILAECGSEPVVVEPTEHPAMSQQVKENKRFVSIDRLNK